MPPSSTSNGPRRARSMPRSGRAGLTWLLVGPSVGLVGGVAAGVLESAVYMSPLRAQMTPWLWADALSVSVVSQVITWVVTCTLVGILGGLALRRSGRLRRYFSPSSLAWAAFGVGLCTVVLLGELALRQKLPIDDWTAVAWIALAGILVVLLVARGLKACAGTRPGRLVGRGVGVGVWPALVLAVVSAGVQWVARPRMQSATDFWPPSNRRATSAPGSLRPDVVLVVSDTLRADRLGCYGYTRPTSPHLDAFAADAVLFEQAISPGPWTVPAHASIFTGQCPSRHGASVAKGGCWLQDRFATLAERLRDHGYQTVALSNNLYVSPVTNITQGFEDYVEPYRLSLASRGSLYKFAKLACASGGPLGPVLGRWFSHEAGGSPTVEIARRWLGRRDRSKPFFLFVNLMEAHLPYEPPAAYRKAFVPPADLSRSYWIDQSLPAVYEYILTGKPIYTDRDLRILSDLYDARVRQLDDCFAELMRVLAGETDLDRTLVIVVSDHGENLGEHRLMGHQFCVYDTLLRVPLLLRCPTAVAPGRVDRMVQTSDLFPTILGWVGAEATPSDQVTARHLFADATPPSDSVRPNVVAEYLCPPIWPIELVRQRHPLLDPTPWLFRRWALYDRQWKLIVTSDGRTELYDRSSDPRELRNLVVSHRREASRLKQRFAQWRRSLTPDDREGQTGGEKRPVLNPEQRQRLRSLGYVQ